MASTNVSVLEASTKISTSPSGKEEVKRTPEVREVSPDIPNKPIIAYWTVMGLCLMIAFGGFIFGWDTGTISGFINQTDFKRRFGEEQRDGSYQLSDVRTGLIVGIFNIGCAVGG